MKFVLYKKDNATEILPPLLLKPTYMYCICTRAMPRAKKRSAKGSSFKEDDSALAL